MQGPKDEYGAGNRKIYGSWLYFVDEVKRLWRMSIESPFEEESVSSQSIITTFCFVGTLLTAVLDTITQHPLCTITSSTEVPTQRLFLPQSSIYTECIAVNNHAVMIAGFNQSKRYIEYLIVDVRSWKLCGEFRMNLTSASK